MLQRTRVSARDFFHSLQQVLRNQGFTDASEAQRFTGIQSNDPAFLGARALTIKGRPGNHIFVQPSLLFTKINSL